jgi:metal-responsive CopG/Arc/MetJ family transcriptional regulator
MKRYSAKLWLRLEAQQMERIDRFRESSRRKTITVTIRDLIQKGLDLEAARAAREKLAGALCLVYDCGAEGLTPKLVELQLKAADIILSKTRVGLGSRLCLKVFALKGSRERIQGLLDRLLALEGVARAWFSECHGGVIKPKAVRQALSRALAENGWTCAGRDMVLAMPIVLSCGAEALWKQLLAVRPEGHDIAVSCSVHLKRDAFLHVAVFKKPSDADGALFPLSRAGSRGPVGIDGMSPEGWDGHVAPHVAP